VSDLCIILVAGNFLKVNIKISPWAHFISKHSGIWCSSQTFLCHTQYHSMYLCALFSVIHKCTSAHHSVLFIYLLFITFSIFHIYLLLCTIFM